MKLHPVEGKIAAPDGLDQAGAADGQNAELFLEGFVAGDDLLVAFAHRKRRGKSGKKRIGRLEMDGLVAPMRRRILPDRASEGADQGLIARSRCREAAAGWSKEIDQSGFDLSRPTIRRDPETIRPSSSPPASGSWSNFARISSFGPSLAPAWIHSR